MLIHSLEQAITALRHVQLDSSYSPAQILHVILAGGAGQSLYNIETGNHQSALQFLCTQTREIEKYPIPGGIVKLDDSGRPYFVAGTQEFPVSLRENEMLGTLTAAGINLKNTPVVADNGAQFTLLDLAKSASTAFRFSSNEPSWSLQLFSVYPGVDEIWTNQYGENISVQTILDQAIRTPYGQGSCLGTHLIEGISFAVSRYCLEHDVEPAELEGTWQDAYRYFLGALKLMEVNRNSDGSIERSWFRKSRVPKSRSELRETMIDLTARRVWPAKAILYPTGHCLDAISPLYPFLRDQNPWLAEPAYVLAVTIHEHWNQIATELNALSHAVHALKLMAD